MDKDFILDKVIYNEENSIVMLGKDKTCIKKVDLPKCFTRLRREAECLKILEGRIAPKLISYDDEEHELRMEYIEGMTLVEYVSKYNEIPKWFFSKLVEKLYCMLEAGIEYGGDMKLGEHVIIQPEMNDIRIIDYGISNILENKQSIDTIWKDCYKRTYAFIFEDTKTDQTSRDSIEYSLQCIGITEAIIDEYFKNYETI